MQSFTKVVRVLVWLTQLGLSIVAPMVMFVLLAVWLRNHFGFGNWMIWVGIVLGLLGTFGALRSGFRTLHRMLKQEEQKLHSPSFNDHT